jgi:hypothetical protein
MIGRRSKQRRNEQAYRLLVADYVRSNVRIEPGTTRMSWPDVVEAVQSYGKTLGEFARDWRAADQRLPVSNWE